MTMDCWGMSAGGGGEFAGAGGNGSVLTTICGLDFSCRWPAAPGP